MAFRLRTILNKIWNRIERPYQLVLVPIAAALATNAFLGNLLWKIASTNHPEFPWLTHPLMAAMLEPITTKLLPAVLIIAHLRLHYPTLIQRVQHRSIPYAFSLGLLVGVAEILLVKIPNNLNDPLHLVFICGVPTALMHGLTGLFVASGVFGFVDYAIGEQVTIMSRNVGDRLFWTILSVIVGLGTALVFHVWWNTGGTELIYHVVGLGWC